MYMCTFTVYWRTHEHSLCDAVHIGTYTHWLTGVVVGVSCVISSETVEIKQVYKIVTVV